jgi:hypothetical protein
MQCDEKAILFDLEVSLPKFEDDSLAMPAPALKQTVS